MSRQCDLTGKRRKIVNKVSHAHNKTKVAKQVNLHNKKVFDPDTGTTVTLRLSAKAIKSLDKVGSLTKYIKKNKSKFL